MAKRKACIKIKYNKQTDLLKTTTSKLTLINLQPNIKGWVMYYYEAKYFK